MATHFRVLARLGGMVAFTAAGFARAQAEPKKDPPPETPPAETTPGPRDLDNRPTPPGGIPPSAPAASKPVRPAAEGAGTIESPDDADERMGGMVGGSAELRREGTFLVRQRGSMVRLRSGRWAFVFHKDAQGKAERPMILMPSQNLARMEQLSGWSGGGAAGGADAGAMAHPDNAVFLLTGQVFAYNGRNYILPTIPPPLFHADPASPQGPIETGVGAAGGTRAGPDPSVEELIRGLETERDKPRTLVPTATGEAEAPRPTAAELLPEGTLLVRRRGHLMRVGAGDWAFVMDSDADGNVKVDLPMILVPCLNLERLEASAEKGSADLLVEMSGRALVYHGRNYIVPTLYQILPPTDLEPRQ